MAIDNETSPLPHFTAHKIHDGIKKMEEEVEAYGPFAFLNPTTRKYALRSNRRIARENANGVGGEGGEESDGKVAREKANGVGGEGGGESDKRGGEEEGHKDGEGVRRVWRARDNRKGRHALTITPSASANPKFHTPSPTSSLGGTLHGLKLMFTWYPIWDVSYLVATIFTLGSVVWVTNAFFVWLPLQVPSSEFKDEITSAGGITAFIGATIFEFGSVFLMIEAVNENRSECFGWAVEEAIEEEGWSVREDDGCTHHHRNKKNLVGKGRAVEGKPPLDVEMGSKEHPASSNAQTWTWLPSWTQLRTHYFKEIGFLACLAQMIGATIFWISGFTALPPIYDRLTSTAAQNGAYWLPQVLGGTGFIVSGTLFMLETQQKWYLPAPKVLGWNIGVWNLLGGIGFTLCGALGFGAANSGCVYQGSLATFWGSWCFLIGSVIQWFESLSKHPVEVEEGGGRVGDSLPVA